MMDSTEATIKLEPMQQLAEAIKEEDDWTGLTDAKARRKRQNRLNIRAFRRRKALEAQSTSKSTPKDPFVIWKPQPELICGEASKSGSSDQPPSPPKTLPLIPFTTSSTPDPESLAIIFPLPLDHLLTLIQYNVLRACLTNMTILSLLHTTPRECTNMLQAPMFPAPTSIPPSLEPTVTQKSTPHPEWIDILPCPRMRDNAILSWGSFDEDELCRDLIGGLFEGFSDLDETGILVWSDPWHVSGWEVTEGFVRKWACLLKGCREVIEAANKWRELRNEDRLIVEI